MRTYSCTVPAVKIFLKSNVLVFRKKWPLKQASSPKVIDVSKTNNHFTELYCVAVPENIHTPSTEVFWFEHPPLWQFQFRLILSFKNFGLQAPPPTQNSQ